MIHFTFGLDSCTNIILDFQFSIMIIFFLFVFVSFSGSGDMDGMNKVNIINQLSNKVVKGTVIYLKNIVCFLFPEFSKQFKWH